ncbi:hypothetical protein HK104_006512, partial [Borealophlyctis nickersoniae]
MLMAKIGRKISREAPWIKFLSDGSISERVKEVKDVKTVKNVKKVKFDIQNYTDDPSPFGNMPILDDNGEL